MPYAASGGAFTNVAGATTAVAGNVIQSATWDAIHADYGTALTQVMQQLLSMTTNRNALYMNGGLEVWQRGAGSSASIPVAASTLAYTADRWYIQTGLVQAHVVSAQTGLSNGSLLCARILRTAAQTGATQMVFAYPFDSDEIARLKGNKVSFTCLANTGANWSPTNGTLTATLYCGTGAVGKRNATPYTGETSAFAIATNLTAGGATATITGNSAAVIPTTTTQMELQFSWTPIGTAGAADWVQIDDVQVEPQLSATTWTPTNFDRIDFSRQLQACQRFYIKTMPYGVHVTVSAGTAGCAQLMAYVANTSLGYEYRFPTRLRVTASVTVYNPVLNSASWYNIATAVSITANVDPFVNVSDANIFIIGVSSSNAGNVIAIHIAASAGI